MKQIRILLAAILSMVSFALAAQNTISISGTVTDGTGEPIPGAGVLVVGGTSGAITDLDGRYVIEVSPDAILEFSCIGMNTVKEKVAGRQVIDVCLVSDENFLESVVVVGYGTQKKGSITGSVAAISSDNIVKTKSENPQNMLTGKLPGVRVWQKSSEPGAYSNSMDIRGFGEALVIIDGVPRSMADFQRMNAADIENISVLKDASAAIYGVRGGNGVILVTTKAGSEGAVKVGYNGSFTFQTPAKMPRLADAVGAMTLFNEMSMNRSDGSGSLTFTNERIEQYRNGTLKAADWNSLVLTNMAPQTQHDVSISGGNEKVQFYSSFGHLYQQGFFRSGDLNYGKTNLKSNITANILKGLKFNLNLSAFMDERNTPDTDAVNLIRNYWKQGVLFPAYADEEQTMLSYQGLDLQQNTVAMMTADVSGYKRYRQKQLQSSATLDFDFGEYIDQLKGLKIKLLGSYDFAYNDNVMFQKEYTLYSKLSDGSYATTTFSGHENKLTRENYSNDQVLAQAILSYDRTFGRHRMGVLGGFETQRRKGDTYYLSGLLAFASPYITALKDPVESTTVGLNPGGFFEYAYRAFIGRLNYSFDERYLIEGQFRYDQSSKFAPGHQWGFFPSMSAAWRISEEPFFKSSPLSFINQMKLRVSYGSLGDDNDLNYEWLTGYTYPATSGNSEKGYYNQYAPGYIIDGAFIYGVATGSLPNTNITWATSKTFDLGLDFEAWQGKLGITFDYFMRRRTGLFGKNTAGVPTVVGATAPTENLNSDAHQGLELQISHRNKVDEFEYGVSAMASLTRKKVIYWASNNSYANSYDKWRNDHLNNRNQGVQFGYESAGRYESWADIWNYDIYKDNSTLPGDYKYLDWNGDGEINSLDEHPFAYDQTPWLNYSLNFDCSWKGLDFNLLLQGSGMGSMEYKEPLYSIWGTNGGGALEQYLDRWHPVQENADPYDQSLEWVKGYYGFTGHYPKSNSSFNRVSTAYLRVKSIEIGYTMNFGKNLPCSLRVYANAYNPLTFTKVKFVDPEHPDDDLGRMYPLNKTYTLGVSFSF